MIVDDHTLFRSGIKALLQRQKTSRWSGEAGDGLEGVKRAKALQPDVVLLDLHMPGISGRGSGQAADRGGAGRATCCMLTVSRGCGRPDRNPARRRAGYLLKNIETEFSARRHPQRGRTRRIGDVAADDRQTGAGLRSAGQGAMPAASRERDKLSPREREIIILLAKGASNKEIARTLNVAESTVKIHVQNILRKLNLTSRVQAAVYAVEAGLVSYAALAYWQDCGIEPGSEQWRITSTIHAPASGDLAG